MSWIVTQNKQRIINSDQAIDIFIDRTGTKIMAETTRDGDFFELGTYAGRDECMKILIVLCFCIAANVIAVSMPLGGDVEKWLSETEEVAKGQVFLRMQGK